MVICGSNIIGNIEEIEGKLKKQDKEDKLLSSILEGEKEEEGKLLRNAVNNNLFSFNPDIMFQQIVKDYSLAKQLYGESFVREIADEKDVGFPEVQRKIKQKILDKFESLKDDKIINKNLEITEKGLNLAALSLYVDEINNLVSKGLIGEKFNKEISHYGNKEEIKEFKRGDNYRNIALRKSIRLAIKRSHNKIEKRDLRIFEKQSKGKINLVYALDASGSMKGAKIDMCKKAGVALAFKAIQEKDEVGLLVFGSKVEDIVYPTHDFMMILNKIANIRAKQETNIASTIIKAIELFPNDDSTKHLILITDAMPTKGDNPEKETLDAVENAYNSGITISLIGINLDKKGEVLAERITQIGNGKLQVVKNLENLDMIVLEDYYSL
ncbi:VWA domain-containing protein [Candidatus Woesearchaeota archaeon]|nr:VWA domain-containing protein [Candidatus Woesearchaeota archaeon]